MMQMSVYHERKMNRQPPTSPPEDCASLLVTGVTDEKKSQDVKHVYEP